MIPLHQDDPRLFSTYTQYKSYSYTDSLDSYQNGAELETQVYWREGRIPTKEIVIHLFRRYTAEKKKDLDKLRTKIFSVLSNKTNQLDAVANIEVTEGSGTRGTVVHFHVLTDDPRSERELRAMFNKACEDQGLTRESDCPGWDDDLLMGYADADFRIDYRVLWNGYKYFRYFTKWGVKWRNSVILFQKGLRMQKFYEIGNWFSRKKTEIRKEILAERKAWAIAKQEEEDRQRAELQRADDEFWEMVNNTCSIPNYNDNELSSELIQREQAKYDICTIDTDGIQEIDDKDDTNGVIGTDTAHNTDKKWSRAGTMVYFEYHLKDYVNHRRYVL